MKKQLLLCSALALAGCNSSPTTGDVEKFLEPKFASCENIKVVDIKKTNGYEEDGYYRVEYSYGIALKDASQLKEFGSKSRSALLRPKSHMPSEIRRSQRCANKLKRWKKNPLPATNSLTMGSYTIRRAYQPAEY